jgi:hypothetical protein
MIPDERKMKWAELYYALLKTLSRWGRDQSEGEPTDYLVVDDDYGGWSQKICLVNPSLPIDQMVSAIQSLLVTSFSRWDVFVLFEDGTSREGLRLYADRVVRQSDIPDEL